MTQHTRTYTWTDPQFDPERLKTMTGMEYLQAIARGALPAAPIGATIGMLPFQEGDLQEGRVVFRLKPQGYQYNPIGSVHGGVYATLLDSAVGCAIHTMLPAGATYTTLELKVNYIRPLFEGSPEVQAIGQVVAITNQTGIAEGRIVDAQGKLYAHCTTTCLIKRPKRMDDR